VISLSFFLVLFDAFFIEKTDHMESVKECIKGIFSAFLAYLYPIIDPLTALAFVLISNMLVGWFAGVWVQDERFSFNKAFNCFKESFVIVGLIAAIYFLTEKNGNPEQGIYLTSYAVYLAILVYSINITRNLRIIYPKNLFIKVVYYFISLEFTKVIRRAREERYSRSPYFGKDDLERDSYQRENLEP